MGKIFSKEKENTDAKECKKRICVIGAGPSGLTTLYALRDLGYEVVCYDKQKELGGMWVFNEATGIDPRGEVVPSCMYRNLWSNGPKECLEFAQFTCMDAFGISLPAFPSREVMLRYLQLFAEKFDLNKYFTFDTTVVECTWDEAKKKFTVVGKNCTSKEETTSDFDHVVVATGHFSYPNLPKPFPGQDTFPGTIMHSSVMRNNEIFKDKRVLSIGGSYSAESVVMEAYKHGCTYVTNSYRSAATHMFDVAEQSENKADEHPLIEKIEGSKVTFKDGFSNEYDIIVWCTGYKHEFPFMEERLRLKTANLMYVDGLYKGVVYQNQPELFYIGAQDLFYSFTLFMQESLWLAAYLKGDISLPDLAAQKEHTAGYMKEQEGLETEEDLIRFQTKHCEELGKDCGAPSVDVADIFLKWEHDRHHNIFTHRDCIYNSPFQDHVESAKPGKPWKDCYHPRDYLGDEIANHIKLDEWIEKVGGKKMKD